MLLLGNVGVLGLGTLLIGELPRQPSKAGSLIGTALIIVGMVGGGLGLLFALIAPRLSAEMGVLAETIGNTLLFTLGVSLTAVSLLVDQAVVGLLRADLQLWRNVIFTVVKLFALLMAGLWLAKRLGLTIYATWLIGNMVSLAALAGFAQIGNRGTRLFRPEWALLGELRLAALGHHMLNLALQAPGLVLPIVVTTVLSTRMNAYFYASWMIASIAAVAPVALTTVLYAVGAADAGALANRLRLTLSLSVLSGLVASIVLLFGADFVLGLFGATYAEHAAWGLRILALGIFPLIIKNHFVAVRRIEREVMNTALFIAAGGVLELIMAASGASAGGLAGLSLGWVLAIGIESIFMVRAVYRVAVPAISTA
jgi:O-antigen/teichoic acid export membrane protein